MSGSRRQRSRDWHSRQSRDAFVKEAQRQGYRSRAAPKLEAIDRVERLLRPGMSVIDLGAAPGSWSQFVAAKVGDNGQIIAVDRLSFDAVPGVHTLIGDLADAETIGAMSQFLSGASVDLVISDMAPNISGVRATDEAGFENIFHIVDGVCARFLRPGGSLLAKVFEGEAAIDWQKRLKGRFAKQSRRKPPASRDRSREYYVVARDYTPLDNG